jgi:hypothetical protein
MFIFTHLMNSTDKEAGMHLVASLREPFCGAEYKDNKSRIYKVFDGNAETITCPKCKELFGAWLRNNFTMEELYGFILRYYEAYNQIHVWSSTASQITEDLQNKPISRNVRGKVNGEKRTQKE